MKRITISDIATLAGVSKSTVSFVINSRNTKIQISEKTRRKVLDVIKEVNYQPNAAAQALSTNRTGNIGLLLSDNICGGWRNQYFVRILSGVEQACRDMGYGLNIGRYNLSDLDSFVFPKNISQRRVDAIVLAGSVSSGVQERFRKFDIPCVVIGDNIEEQGVLPFVCVDVVSGLVKGIEYAIKQGYSRIGICPGSSKRSTEIYDSAIEHSKHFTGLEQITLLKNDHVTGDHTDAKGIMDTLLKLPEDKRPNLIIANDQISLGMLKEIRVHGLRCPEDIALLATGDNTLCQLADPEITVLDFNCEKLAADAVRMLVEHLDKKIELTPKQSRSDYQMELTIRNSCPKKRENSNNGGAE